MFCQNTVRKSYMLSAMVPDTMGMYTLRVNTGAVIASSLFSNGSPYGSTSIENNSVTFTVRAKE